MTLPDLDEWVTSRGLILNMRIGGGMFWAQLSCVRTGFVHASSGKSSTEAIAKAQEVFERETKEGKGNG